MATSSILLQVVAKPGWTDVYQLLDKIQDVGRRLANAQPRELVIRNIVRRVMGLIRDEALEDRAADDAASETTEQTDDAHAPPQQQQRAVRPPVLTSASSFALPHSFSLLGPELTFDALSMTGSGTSTPMGLAATAASVRVLRSEVIDGIGEIQDEIKQADDQIATFAEVQIHPGDYVMVYRPTATVEKFLVKAAAKRRFTVLLTGEPLRKGEETPYASLRKKLAAHHVNTIRIASNGAMAYMARVNKVVLDARAMDGSGGVFADGGAGLVARAAHELGRTVIALGGVYKVSPEEPPEVDVAVELGDSAALVPFSQGGLIEADVENVLDDYLEPGLVDIYVTNLQVSLSLKPARNGANSWCPGELTRATTCRPLFLSTTKKSTWISPCPCCRARAKGGEERRWIGTQGVVWSSEGRDGLGYWRQPRGRWQESMTPTRSIDGQPCSEDATAASLPVGP